MIHHNAAKKGVHGARKHILDLGLAVPLVADIMQAMGGSAAIRCTPSGQVIQLAILNEDAGRE